MSQLLLALRSESWSLAALAVALGIAVIAQQLLFAAAARIAARTRSALNASLVQHCRAPSALIVPLAVLFVALPELPWPEPARNSAQHLVVLGSIAAFAWLGVRLSNVLVDLLAARYPLGARDNLRARRIATQAQLLRRIAVVLIVFVAISLMLMTFPSIRHIGITLFASAGVAGLVAGMAARPVLANLLAGVQIALTEPIRLDDVVIVEGEWGWIEEIGTTYVVVRIGDLRRLVVPLSYFIEHPFQTTRLSA